MESVVIVILLLTFGVFFTIFEFERMESEQWEKRDIKIWLLTEVYERMEDNKACSMYICYELDHVVDEIIDTYSYEEGKQLGECKHEIQNYIHDLIYPCVTLDQWLEEKGIYLNTEQMIQYRLEFISMLIEHIAENE